MALILEKKRSYYDRFGAHETYHVRPWYVEPCVVETSESEVDLKVERGMEIVASLPREFRRKNHGRFLAIAFTGRILAVCDTLEELNKELFKQKIKENYYMERLGFDSIAQID